MHWYKNGKRHEFLKADGTPYLRIPRAKIVGSGAVPGATDVLSSFGKSFWMPKYFGELGVDAAIKGYNTEASIEQNREVALKLLAIMSDEPADRGTMIHWAIQQFYLGKNYGSADEELDTVLRTAVKSFDEQVRLLMPTAVTIRSEVQFSTNEYGGTIDIEGYDANETRVGVLDAKSVKEARAGRLSECAQLTAYLRGHSHETNEEGGLYQIEDNPMLTVGNIYLDSATGNHISNRVWTKEERVAGWQLFQASLDAFNVYWAFEES